MWNKWQYQGGKGGEGRQQGGVVDQWFLRNPKGEIWANPDVSVLVGPLLLVIFAFHSVVDLKLTRPNNIITYVEGKKTLISTNITTSYHILVEKNSNWSNAS